MLLQGSVCRAVAASQAQSECAERRDGQVSAGIGLVAVVWNWVVEALPELRIDTERCTTRVRLEVGDPARFQSDDKRFVPPVVDGGVVGEPIASEERPSRFLLEAAVIFGAESGCELRVARKAMRGVERPTLHVVVVEHVGVEETGAERVFQPRRLPGIVCGCVVPIQRPNFESVVGLGMLVGAHLKPGGIAQAF